MIEIGGYFGMEISSGCEYYPDLIPLNNGRNALLYLLKARNIRKIYLPVFICGSLRYMCDKYGYEYECYHISEDFLPIFEKDLRENEYIYIVNYYGRISNEKIVDLKKQFRNVIFDNVQAFFQKPVEGIDTVYSCRKFFGVPDGSYLSTDVIPEEEPEQDISMDRMTHILGRLEYSAADYYSKFRENDEMFRTLPLRKMSVLTHNLLRSIDYEQVIKKRNSNYNMLCNLLDKSNKLKTVMVNGPYTYPFFCENGEKIRFLLSKEKIYIATLWKDTFDCNPTDVEKSFTQNILPVPIDQRYTTDDMKYVAQKILEYIH